MLASAEVKLVSGHASSCLMPHSQDFAVSHATRCTCSHTTCKRFPVASTGSAGLSSTVAAAAALLTSHVLQQTLLTGYVAVRVDTADEPFAAAFDTVDKLCAAHADNAPSGTLSVCDFLIHPAPPDLCCLL